MNTQLQNPPQRYAALAAALTTLAPATHVFIGQYPDLLKDDQGNLCKTRTILSLRASEIKWMYESFYLPLNAAIQAAAKKHNWHLVTGQAAAFAHHGYCATNRWIVQYNESKARQGDTNGTLHPNLTGQTEIANLFYPAVHNLVK
jgi:hypothetical protein